MSQRDERGRFVPGNKASPGRLRRETEADYLIALTNKVTMVKWEQIVDRALTDAIAGDYRARQWISDYVIGKPVTTIDLRAGEQAQLAQVLELLKAKGVPASSIFEALIAELTTAELIEEGSEDDR